MPRFATTHWSVVVAAGETETPRARAALETLCQAYWYPIYAFARRRGLSEADAQERTQEFFTRCERDSRRSVSKRTPPGKEPKLGDLFPDGL